MALVLVGPGKHYPTDQAWHSLVILVLPDVRLDLQDARLALVQDVRLALQDVRLVLRDVIPRFRFWSEPVTGPGRLTGMLAADEFKLPCQSCLPGETVRSHGVR